MSRKAGIWLGLVWGLVFCVLAVAGGIGAGYFVDSGLFSKGNGPVVLNEKFSFSGPFSQDDLKLSRAEIISLNQSAWRTRDVLTRMDIQVGAEIWDGSMDGEDQLQYSFEFRIKGGGVVKTWAQETLRRKLVDDLERYMETAAAESRRLRKDRTSFKVMYI